MCRPLFLVPLLGALLWVPSLHAGSDDQEPESFPSFAAEFVLGVPVWTGVFQVPSPGLRLEYDLSPGPWGFEVGYSFHSLSPYEFDHQADRWSGPYALADGDPDWPFFQTKHIVSAGVLYLWRHGPFTLKTAMGLLAQFTLVSEAAQYYPDFQAAYDASQLGVKNFLGNYWKFGIESRAWSWLNYGVDFAFEIPTWNLFLSQALDNPLTYARNHSHLELRLGVKL